MYAIFTKFRQDIESYPFLVRLNCCSATVLLTVKFDPISNKISYLFIVTPYSSSKSSIMSFMFSSDVSSVCAAIGVNISL